MIHNKGLNHQNKADKLNFYEVGKIQLNFLNNLISNYYNRIYLKMTKFKLKLYNSMQQIKNEGKKNLIQFKAHNVKN